MKVQQSFRLSRPRTKTILAVTAAWFALSWVVLADPCTNRAENLFVANAGNNTIVKINSIWHNHGLCQRGDRRPISRRLNLRQCGQPLRIQLCRQQQW